MPRILAIQRHTNSFVHRYRPRFLPCDPREIRKCTSHRAAHGTPLPSPHRQNARSAGRISTAREPCAAEPCLAHAESRPSDRPRECARQWACAHGKNMLPLFYKSSGRRAPGTARTAASPLVPECAQSAASCGPASLGAQKKGRRVRGKSQRGVEVRTPGEVARTLDTSRPGKSRVCLVRDANESRTVDRANTVPVPDCLI
jgi:hypothetical protein